MSSVLLDKHGQTLVVDAIRRAELNTSGEIRVHVEKKCPGDPVERAIEVFNRLEMYNTKDRNGVVVYVAVQSRKFSIVGDSGINSKVGDDFWDDVKEIMKQRFSSGDITGGLVSAVEAVGLKLKDFFPYSSDDVNEQPDEISFG